MTGGHMADGDEPGWREREVALTSNELTPKQLAAVLRTLARGYHVDSGALEALNAAALIVEKATPAHETSERQPAVTFLREVLENISTVRPLEHFPAVTALAYCREKAIEALNATRAFQEVIVGEYEANGKANMASSPLPEGTKLYARLPLRHSQKAGEHRHGAAQDFVSYDPYGGVRVDMARYLRSPAGQAQLQALGGKKAVDQRAIDANALAEAHRMYEAEHGHPFSESEPEQHI